MSVIDFHFSTTRHMELENFTSDHFELPPPTPKHPSPNKRDLRHSIPFKRLSDAKAESTSVPNRETIAYRINNLSASTNFYDIDTIRFLCK
ncbi:hypothetical protein CEXT_288361 [Caerostris extrusa]|uniref:Uncharacterized protein n=1 Tax=Caerostris extrusa TaxID=172846 RepID=A0AAV4MNE3_CAEEX|nr:hypothetical protein CEXT_288361 [Caerostris extrusa]